MATQYIEVRFDDGVKAGFVVFPECGRVVHDHSMDVVGKLAGDRFIDGPGAEWGSFQVLSCRPCRLEAGGVALL